jgi:WD40 repeat protein
MNTQKALVILDTILEHQHLNDIQELVFRQVLEGKSYPQIAVDTGYDANYVKDVGAKLWKLLSDSLGEKVSKGNLQAILRRYDSQPQVLGENDGSPSSISTSPTATLQSVPILDAATHVPKTDWGEVLDISAFYGRTAELATLKQWILIDRCRLVTLLGIGGIGKTALSVKLTETVKDHFEYVIWRSLRHAPLLPDLLTNLNQVLSDQLPIDLHFCKNAETGISSLITHLQAHRCLLILDNAETVLRGGDYTGYYREGYEDYRELLLRIGEVRHQSCLVLTSREKPRELMSLEGDLLPVRSLQLKGLKTADIQALFQTKGQFALADGSEWEALVDHYAGNPLALKIVAANIQYLCDGSLSEFLELLRQNIIISEDIHHLLERQFNRLSASEKEVMYWLAIEREPITFKALQDNLLSIAAQQKLLETIGSLGQRSLIEKATPALTETMTPKPNSQATSTRLDSSLAAARFTQQPVVMEFVTEQLIKQIQHEIVAGEVVLLNRHALLKGQAKDYIRNTQVRLILQPLLNALLEYFGNQYNLERWFAKLLANLQQIAPHQAGYAAGNLLNLLCELHTNLSGYDFSHLVVWQAYLQGRTLRNINFAHCDLTRSVFTQTFGAVFAVTFSPDGQRLATGDVNGEISVWRVSDMQLLLTCQEHTNQARSLAWNPAGTLLASGSADCTVRLWDVQSGQVLKILQGHTNQIGAVAWSPDGNTLASGSSDCTVKLWDVFTGQVLTTLRGHANWVRSIAWSPDGTTLASGSDDHTIRLWDVDTGQLLKILQGHANWVRSIAWSPNGTTLASGSADCTIRVWNARTGQVLNILQGHTNWVRSIAWSPDGTTLASGSDDHTIRLWDVDTGQLLKILQGHTNWIRSVAWSPVQFQGRGGSTLSPQELDPILVSGSSDCTVKLWNARSGQILKTLQGHINWVRSVAWNPNGTILASGSDDHAIRLWDTHAGQVLKTLQGHSSWVWSVAWSPDGKTLASGSADCNVRLWDANTGRVLKILHGHINWVWSVAWSPDSCMLASGSDDHAVRLWDVHTGQVLKTLQGHTNWVRSVTWSPDGQTLASGGGDCTIRLWNVHSGDVLKTLHGHDNQVGAVTFSPDGHLLVSGSDDHTVKLWDVHTGAVLKTLHGHTNWVGAVDFSPDGHVLASGSDDHTVKLWDVHTGDILKTLYGHANRVGTVKFSPDCQILTSGSSDETIQFWDIKTGERLKTLRAAKPYDGMNITGAIGLTAAQRRTLTSLGALESDAVRIGC